MKTRLMFSTIISLSPDILILDEVLSVGDAYFVGKSFNKINQLISNGNKTLILVSHDIYSLSKICNRFILLDEGKVLIDQEGMNAIHFYENMIKMRKKED